MTTISTSDEDYLLNISRHNDHEDQQSQHIPPSEVTVSSLDELQSTVRERDARIAFLERELVETRLQLALVSASKDQLSMELAKATKKINKSISSSVLFSEPREISSDDVRVVPQASIVPPETHPAVAIDTSEGNTVRVPLGQSIASHAGGSSRSSIRRTISYSRRGRNAVQRWASTSSSSAPDSVAPASADDDDWNNLNPGSCASGLDLLAGDGDPSSRRSAAAGRRSINETSNNNASSSSTSARQNLNSCASGLDLLAGGIMSSRAQNSSLSINRMLGDIGLTASEISLKKRKSGDVAAGHRAPRSTHRRVNTLAGHYHSNEGWGDAAGAGAANRPQGNNMFQPQGGANVFAGVMQPPANMTAGAALAQLQANNIQVNNINRLQGGGQRARSFNAGPQQGANLFTSGTQPPRANLFADLINSRPSFNFEPPSEA